jgi:replicative DNA helicase
MTAPPAPPHDLEAEQAILGAVLLSERTMYAFVFEEDVKAEHSTASATRASGVR